MIAALWPSDTTDLDTLLTRIAEIQAGGDTVYCPLDVMERAMALMTERREMTGENTQNDNRLDTNSR